MIIDVHTHVFPDRIANKTIKTLEQIGNQTAVTNGTVKELIESMDSAGISKSVVLPVVTKPEQTESINYFAAKLNKNPRIISFAGIHPLCENFNKTLDLIVENGFKGIKLHPDYQNTDITDENYIRIIEGCRKRGLVVSIHAGIDPSSPEHIHCKPDDAAEIVRELTKDKPFIILAHFGGINYKMTENSRLIGGPAYIDTSFALNAIEREEVCEIVKKHGYGKVLFGTDSPWRNQAEYIQIIKSLPLIETESDAILGKNCAELLNFNYI